MIQTPGDGLLRVSLLIQSLCITVLSSVSGVLVSTSLSQLLDSSTDAKWSHQVSYRPTDSSDPKIRLNTTDLETSFTTQSDLEEGTEIIFSVRAYTRVGPGNTSSITVSTLGRKSKMMVCNNCAFSHTFCIIILFYIPAQIQISIGLVVVVICGVAVGVIYNSHHCLSYN